MTQVTEQICAGCETVALDYRSLFKTCRLYVPQGLWLTFINTLTCILQYACVPYTDRLVVTMYCVPVTICSLTPTFFLSSKVAPVAELAHHLAAVAGLRVTGSHSAWMHYRSTGLTWQCLDVGASRKAKLPSGVSRQLEISGPLKQTWKKCVLITTWLDRVSTVCSPGSFCTLPAIAILKTSEKN